MPINDFVAGTIALSLMLQPILQKLSVVGQPYRWTRCEASRSLRVSYGQDHAQDHLAWQLKLLPNFVNQLRHCPERYGDRSAIGGLLNC